MPLPPIHIALRVIPYVAFYFLLASLSCPLFLWLGGYLVGITASLLFAAVSVNWLAMRIFENRPLADAGLWWNHRSADNLAFGLAGGFLGRFRIGHSVLNTELSRKRSGAYRSAKPQRQRRSPQKGRDNAKPAVNLLAAGVAKRRA